MDGQKPLTLRLTLMTLSNFSSSIFSKNSSLVMPAQLTKMHGGFLYLLIIYSNTLRISSPLDTSKNSFCVLSWHVVISWLVFPESLDCLDLLQRHQPLLWLELDRQPDQFHWHHLRTQMHH